MINLNGHAPPSAFKRRPMAWAIAGSAGGAMVFSAALSALWRDLPGLPAPAGSLATHAGYWFSLALHALAPDWHAARASEYLAHLSALSARGQIAPIVWRVAVSGALAVAPALLLAPSCWRAMDGLLHVRGPSRLAGRAAVKALNKALRRAVKARPDHYITPLVQYPADLWTRHTLVVGGVGSGKTTALLPIAERVSARGENLVAFDTKGDFTSALPRAALIAPWDARSDAWDIARDLRAIGDIRRFAEALVPQGTDPFWANASREILVGSILYLRQSQGQLWGWADLAAELVRPMHELKALMDRFNPTAARLIEKPGITAQGILSSLSAHCAPITDLGAAWGHLPLARRVSLVEWALAKPARAQIIVQGHASYPQLTKFLAQGMLGAVAGLASSPQLSDSWERKLWLIADEAAQMGKAPLQEICSVGRSKGIRAVIATQDFAQLESIHGKEAVQSLISMCGTLIVGQLAPGQTAETLAKALGSREVERRNVSVSAPGGATTVSFAREDLPLYKASELGTRLGKDAKGTGMVMALATGGSVYELTWPIVQRRPRRRPHVPAPWTTSSSPSAVASSTAPPSSSGNSATATPAAAAAVSRAVNASPAAQSPGGAAAPPRAAGGGAAAPATGDLADEGFDWDLSGAPGGAPLSDPFAGLESVDDADTDEA